MNHHAIYENIVNGCISSFEAKHGKCHDRYIWSKKVYARLSALLKRDRFDFAIGIRWTYADRCDILFSIYDASKMDYIVNRAEHDVLSRLYQSVISSKSAGLRNRVARLENIAETHINDVDYMTAFLGVALRKRKLTDEDYDEFRKFVANHNNQKVLSDLGGYAITCLISMCA